MRLRDLSLKTKLQAANVLMVVIPIAVLIVIGAALLGGLHHTGSLQQQALALLWPEQGRTLSVQFALSSLRAAAEKRKFKLHRTLPRTSPLHTDSHAARRTPPRSRRHSARRPEPCTAANGS